MLTGTIKTIKSNDLLCSLDSETMPPLVDWFRYQCPGVDATAIAIGCNINYFDAYLLSVSGIEKAAEQVEDVLEVTTTLEVTNPISATDSPMQVDTVTIPDIANMSGAEAIAIIKTISDVSVLKVLQQTELSNDNRKTVLAAIANRLDDL